MQREQVFHPPNQQLLDSSQVVGTLRQHQDLPTLPECHFDRRNDSVCSLSIVSELPEDLLNADVLGHRHRLTQPLRHYHQINGSARRPRRNVPDGPALHEDNRMLAIPAHRRSGQSEHIPGGGAL
ncbi:hypothetical protein FQZ97_832230 [compost metagenome]